MRLFFHFVLGVSSFLYGNTPAPGGPGVPFPWATSEKQGFGTAYEAYDTSTAPVSKVWFTIARGIVTEVFYPRIDTPQSRDTQLLITDRKRFLHQEQYDTLHEVHRSKGSPFFRVVNRDPENRYLIQKEIWADPDRSLIIQNYQIETLVDGLEFYVLHKPASANSIFGDTATTHPLLAGENRGELTGWQGVSASIPWERQSVGHVGVNDGFTDLLDLKMDHKFTHAKGNTALTGKLNLPPEKGIYRFAVFLVFGPTRDEVLQTLKGCDGVDLKQSAQVYQNQWKEYLSTLSLPLTEEASDRRKELAEHSALLLKSAEDKTYPGSIVASPSHPWGENQVETPHSVAEMNAGYHVVWPRDLYHAAHGLLSVGDFKTARAIVERLKVAQFGHAAGYWQLGPRTHAKHGSFPQNFWVDGRPVWGGYQADETAMPLLLAYRLWKEGKLPLGDTWDMVKAAAQFLSEMGPWTHNERWEENYGISPNSASYVISALVAASEMAFSHKDYALADHWIELADQWSLKPNDNIDTWTFTKEGKIQAPYGNGQYYIRLDGASCNKDQGGSPLWDALWDPNQDGFFPMANYSGDLRFRYESEVVDGGFLALARLGVRGAQHPLIIESLPEIDSLIKVKTKSGAGWYRYRWDAYGEDRRGRLWPLLTGERIHYELQALKELGHPNPSQELEDELQGLESFASRYGMFSEQVWDEGQKEGQPTGSATPLLWSHAEYLQVLRSLRDNRVFDEVPSVRARYGKTAF